MKPLLFAALAVLMLAACESDDEPRNYVHPTPQPESERALKTWFIEFSENLPAHPTSSPDGSFYFDWPIGGEPHYIVGPAPAGGFIGKKQIRARFKIEGDPKAVISGAKCPATSRSAVTLYFNTKEVNWSSNGMRWWAKGLRSAPLVVNSEFEIIAPLDDITKWGTVMKADPAVLAQWFARDKAAVGWVGFTFGNCSGSGHGAWVSGAPVRFTILEYVVE